jgi:hypothetical protein
LRDCYHLVNIAHITVCINLSVSIIVFPSPHASFSGSMRRLIIILWNIAHITVFINCPFPCCLQSPHTQSYRN